MIKRAVVVNIDYGYSFIFVVFENEMEISDLINYNNVQMRRIRWKLQTYLKSNS